MATQSGRFLAIVLVLAAGCSSGGVDEVVTGSSTTIPAEQSGTTTAFVISVPETVSSSVGATDGLRGFDPVDGDDGARIRTAFVSRPEAGPAIGPEPCSYVLVRADIEANRVLEAVQLVHSSQWARPSRCEPFDLPVLDDWAPDIDEDGDGEADIKVAEGFRIELLHEADVVIAASRLELEVLLPQAREQWAAAGISEYAMDITPSCFCRYGNTITSVRDEIVVDFVGGEADAVADWLTVTETLDWIDGLWMGPVLNVGEVGDIEDVRDFEPPRVVVIFDAATGAPLDYWSDPLPGVLDDELDLRIRYEFPS